MLHSISIGMGLVGGRRPIHAEALHRYLPRHTRVTIRSAMLGRGERLRAHDRSGDLSLRRRLNGNSGRSI